MRKLFIAIPLVLVLLALCAVIAGTLLVTVRGMGISGISLPSFRSLNFSAEADEQKTFDVQAPAALEVKNLSGKVRIEKGSDGQIEMRAHKTARGTSQAAAEQNLERLTIETSQTEDTVKIEVKVDSKGQYGTDWEGSVDFVITVPQDTAVIVDSRFGDLELEGTRGDANLNTTFGSVDVRDVGEGPLTVVTRNGRVTVHNVQAGANTVDLRSDFGDLTVEDVTAGTVEVRSNNGALNLTGVEASGPVDLNSDFGRIEFRDGEADDLKIETKNGEITLSGLTVTGDLTANSQFGGIDLDNVQAAGYELRTSNGGIHVEGAAGPVQASSDFGDVEILNAQDATLDLSSKNGAVRFEGSLGAGPHNLQSDFGAVLLRLPSDAALDMDLTTNFGKIDTEFEVTIQGQPDENHWQGKINGGGDALSVTTKNGNITLEILQ